MNKSFDSVYASKQIAREQNHLRRAVRSVYLRTLLKLTEGAVCDLGCGAGSFLRYAPYGSVGLDINPHAVAYCRASGVSKTYFPVLSCVSETGEPSGICCIVPNAGIKLNLTPLLALTSNVPSFAWLNVKWG